MLTDACCYNWLLFTLFKLGSKMHSRDICPVVKCLLVKWYPVTTGDLLPRNMWNVPNLVRIVLSCDLTWILPGDELESCTESDSGSDTEWSSPLQKLLLFLGSFISSLCLLPVLSICLNIYHSKRHEIFNALFKLTKWNSLYASKSRGILTATFLHAWSSSLANYI